MRVASIQSRAFDLRQYRESLAHILAKIDEAAELNPQLIVVPECAYPSYYLGYSEIDLHNAMDLVQEVIDSVKYKAMKYNTYIAFGLVIKEKGKYFNRGILMDPNGDQVAHVNKSFMWHFDSDWFHTENSQNIVETPFGKWGLIICADGRMPELVRDLALKGVDLIVDLANLTSTGKHKEQLTNAQSNFMLSTRALENNLWLVMADKVGIEARTVTYSGRSCIISPTGNFIAEASPDLEEIIYADIDVTNRSGQIPSRRPDTYHSLTEPTDSLPISKTYTQKVVPSNLVIQGSTVQFFYGNKVEYLNQAKFFIQTLENQLTDIIVLPQSSEAITPHDIQTFITHEETIVFYSIVDTNKINLVCVMKDSIKTYDKVHLTQEEQEKYQPGDHYKVIETPKGNIGVMLGEDGLFPEVARILTFQGADCIVWINELDPNIQEKVSRTRAAENKIFLITSSQLNIWENATSMIIDPNGNIIASTLVNTEQACSTQIPLVLSRCKDIVPKTNAIFHRKPENYNRLIK